MPLPSQRTGVPRDQVGSIVEAMLSNPEVGDVTCTEESGGTYTVTPHPR